MRIHNKNLLKKNKPKSSTRCSQDYLAQSAFRQALNTLENTKNKKKFTQYRSVIPYRAPNCCLTISWTLVSPVLVWQSPKSYIDTWNMAECSESAGRILTLCLLARGSTKGPPAINVSLFARAMSFPASIAATVGYKKVKQQKLYHLLTFILICSEEDTI